MHLFKVSENKNLGLKKHGKQWKKLNKCVPTRTITQIKTHAQKFFIRLENMTPKGTDPLQYLRTMPTKAFSSLMKDYSDSNSRPLQFPSELSSNFNLNTKNLMRKEKVTKRKVFKVITL